MRRKEQRRSWRSDRRSGMADERVMRAAVCRTYGAPEVVEVEKDFPSPALGDGQARVSVRAAAVNFPDVLIVANEYQVSAPLPFVPGSEFAGVVTEVPHGESPVSVGDRVSGT